jgi:GT2 family glycosyltransferase
VQRNVGVRHSRADVLHFVDDDVLLDPRYLECLAETFEGLNAETVVGAGGLITNLPPRSPRWWWRAALLDSRRQGVILPSGFNVMVTAVSQPTEVQWLSGCSMAFRSRAFDNHQFDERLAGYGLMEDVDFSVRAGRSGKLVVNPKARLLHNVSPVERWDFEKRTRASVYRRGWFVQKNMPRISRVAFWWSVATGAITTVVMAVLTASRWRLRIAKWQLMGAVDYLRGAR